MAEVQQGMVATLVGGAGGSVLVSVLMRRGVAPGPAALAMAVAGGLGGLALRGAGRHAAIGAAAASAGMLALMWIERGTALRQTDPRATRGRVYEAFERARRELARDRAAQGVVAEGP